MTDHTDPTAKARTSGSVRGVPGNRHPHRETVDTDWITIRALTSLATITGSHRIVATTHARSTVHQQDRSDLSGRRVYKRRVETLGSS